MNSRIEEKRQQRNRKYTPHDRRRYGTQRSEAVSLPRCPETGKLMFPTEQSAKDELLECRLKARFHGEHWRQEQRAYECDECPPEAGVPQHWHLSTHKTYQPRPQTARSA